jgi:heptosyltransferase-2
MGHVDAAIVVRLANWLGDTVMAMPALTALRAAQPDARITAIGRWAFLLSGQEVADIVLPYPRPLRERVRVGRALRADPPALALLLPNSIESALAARWWRAKRRVGFDTDARRRFLTDAVPLPSPRRHQVDEYAALLEAVDIEVTGDRAPRWKHGTCAGGRVEVEALFRDEEVPSDAVVIGLHVGAAFGPSKLWPAESFGRLASRLIRAGLLPLLLGAPADRPTGAAVVTAAREPLPSLIGRDRPSLLPDLLGRLACLVSGDTGVAHLAAALEVPTVTLFGPTDPQLSAPRGPRAQFILGRAACSPCFRATCPIDHVCLEGIPVDEVECRVREAVPA